MLGLLQNPLFCCFCQFCVYIYVPSVCFFGIWSWLVWFPPYVYLPHGCFIVFWMGGEDFCVSLFWVNELYIYSSACLWWVWFKICRAALPGRAFSSPQCYSLSFVIFFLSLDWLACRIDCAHLVSMWLSALTLVWLALIKQKTNTGLFLTPDIATFNLGMMMISWTIPSHHIHDLDLFRDPRKGQTE